MMATAFPPGEGLSTTAETERLIL